MSERVTLHAHGLNRQPLALTSPLRGAGLYAGLRYVWWGVSAVGQRAWDAPAMDPALLKAIALIFAELMLITAIALFFSTFSSPMLSAAFAFGFFVVAGIVAMT